MLANYDLNSTQPYAPGQVANMEKAEIISAICGASTAQVDTIDFSGGVNNSNLYTLEVTQEGITNSVSFTSDATATAAEVAAGLVAAALADAAFNGMVLAADSGGGIMTLTSQIAGIAFSTAMTGDNAADGSVSTTTANAARADLYPGRLVVRDASNESRCAKPANSNATAQISTVTPANVTNAESYSITIKGDFNQDGKPEVYVCPAYTSASATVAELCDHFTNWADTLPALTVSPADGATLVTFTSELPGVPFEIFGNVAHDIDDDAAPTGSLAIATTTANVPLRPLGVVHQARNHEQDANGNAYVPGGQSAEIIRKGVIAVELDDGVTPSIGDGVYFRGVAGSSESLGAFRDAMDSSDCRLWPDAEWAESAAYTVRGKRVGLLRLRD